MSDYADTLSNQGALPAHGLKRGASSLVWSDYIFVLAFALTVFIVADPFDLGFEHPAGTKHTPVMLEVAALLMTSLGHALRKQPAVPEGRSWPLLRTGFPFVVLGAWALFGGLYARLFDQIQDTFITTGLYILSAFVAARAVMLCEAYERLVATLCRIMSAAAAFMIVRMLVQHVWSGGMYHEMEFFVVPIAVYFALKPSGSTLQRRLMTLFFLFGGITFLKNTGFIVLAITLIYLFWADWRFQFQDPRRVYLYIVSLAVTLATAVTMVALLGNAVSGIEMPSGNPGYRVRTYERAIARFYESPVWGSLFAARSTARFTAFEISVADGQLPTHSDVLDLAANGGVLALGLLTWGYFRVARVARRTLLHGRCVTDTTAAAHMFACMSVSGIAVYAFNPIMLQPDKAILLWGSLGMLLGCCLHRNNSLPHTLAGRP